MNFVLECYFMYCFIVDDVVNFSEFATLCFQAHGTVLPFFTYLSIKIYIF